jgi:hypothetical protein
LIFHKYTEVSKIIEKEIARVCVFWAQEIINSHDPIMYDARFNFISSENCTSMLSARERHRVICSIKFTRDNVASNGKSSNRAIKNGITVLFHGSDGKDFTVVNFLSLFYKNTILGTC